MKKPDIDKFITILEKEYPCKEKPSSVGVGAWGRILKAISFLDACKALEDMVSDSNKKIYGFPKPGDLKPYLVCVNKYIQCPCCYNSRWLIWQKDDGDTTPAYRCKCASSKKQYEHDGLHICNNINCQNPKGIKRIFVPPGWGYKQRQLLALCKHNPSVTESTNWDGLEVVVGVSPDAQKIINKGLQARLPEPGGER